MDLHELPKAPRRFQIIDENTWVGKPSVPYGVVRRLAHEQRKARGNRYARVLYGEAGRKGDPWGGLELEVNGDIYHFNAGVKRWPDFHDGSGNLTETGKQALATGVPGHLTSGVDWRWVQDEVNLTGQCSPSQIQDIADHFRSLLSGDIALPMFQAQTWAKRLNVAINPEFHNCTTIILQALREKARLVLAERMPLQALDALHRIVGDTRSRLDDELNFLLSMSEGELDTLLRATTAERTIDWNAVAKGTAPLPKELRWESLIRKENR